MKWVLELLSIIHWWRAAWWLALGRQADLMYTFHATAARKLDDSIVKRFS